MAASDHSGLPLIPLSPIAQSYILCSNALSQASEKLNEAKQKIPTVDDTTRLIRNVEVERLRLDTLARKMQSVEAATAFFWDSDTLARQIAIIDCQLYTSVLLNKRALLQLDQKQTKLSHLVDFHRYLTHSMAHQLIYWAELTKPNNTSTPAVVPPVRPKDSLVAHLIRVAYLLLHAYRDFSGFAAIMKALTLPEIRRLKRIWQPCSSRTKEMFRDLAQIISPANNYQAYRNVLRSKLELYLYIHHRKEGSNSSGNMMIAIPWIQAHLSSIQSIVTIYTAGDNEDQQMLGGDIVLSTPGAHKMDIEISILELCQRNSTISDSLLEDILSNSSSDKKKSQRSSIAAASKPIHLEGLRTAVIPTSNLNHLAPGDLLVHHWLVSRVYLRKDQLIDESMEVEPLKQGEQIACEEDDLFDVQKYMPPVSASISRRTSFVLQTSPTLGGNEVEMVAENDVSEEDVVVNQKSIDPSSELKDSNHDDDSDDENSSHDNNNNDNSNDNGGVTEAPKAESLKPNTDNNNKSNNNNEASVKHEVTPHQIHNQDEKSTPETSKEVEHSDKKESPKENEGKSTSVASKTSTAASKPKSTLSPTAREFIPHGLIKAKAQSNTSLASEEKWSGYPVNEDDDNDSETWKGYPVPKSGSLIEEEDEEEVWKGYPGPNSSTDSPRRASSQSETSEEWKGYHATKMEAVWQRESAMKVQEYEWQGYTLETYNEDELDSSTMMDGEFEKSRKARGQQGNGDKLLEDFQRNRNVMIK
ncbi:uncharacterized protein RHIMIDRAFT_242396 [Rhizopus microsporus ATCC 52813]|uniref:Ras-GEF domain-containing protein n=1 Tax=Rhizopus microsporus ATCC 52813 TaxID=1340429 RepID=A0A2G4SG43_RHIZD|nr:uncharacterized protein RHIMIDRAFT_242396 [Rhizopus microsporus ATCC 52813]PHZ07741.1 hypothetical protein RHIMIDRAFT_242396 [Rhizopus microsporus ATCC 52813]